MKMLSLRAVSVLALISAVFFFAPTLVAAQIVGVGNTGQVTQLIWEKTFGFDMDWLKQPRELIVNAIIPSLAVLFISVGLMRATGITRNMYGSIDWMIGIAFMLAALFTGGLGAFTTYFLGVVGQASVWIFAVMFIIGAVLWAKGFYRKRSAVAELEGYYKQNSRNLVQDINKLRDKIMELEKEREEVPVRMASMSAETRDAKIRDLTAQITGLKFELSKKEATYNQLTRVTQESARETASD